MALPTEQEIQELIIRHYNKLQVVESRKHAFKVLCDELSLKRAALIETKEKSLADISSIPILEKPKLSPVLEGITQAYEQAAQAIDNRIEELRLTLEASCVRLFEDEPYSWNPNKKCSIKTNFGLYMHEIITAKFAEGFRLLLICSNPTSPNYKITKSALEESRFIQDPNYLSLSESDAYPNIISVISIDSAQPPISDDMFPLSLLWECNPSCTSSYSLIEVKTSNQSQQEESSNIRIRI